MILVQGFLVTCNRFEFAHDIFRRSSCSIYIRIHCKHDLGMY